jgi:hypothetical protein
MKMETGQVTIEFIILFTFIGALALMLLNPNSGVLQKSLNQTFTYGLNGMENNASVNSGSLAITRPAG